MEDLILHGDCLAIMTTLPDKSIDAVITDPPYGVTQNSWDLSFDLDSFWAEVNRICRGGIILTSRQPFTTKLIASNYRGFKWDDVWEKNKTTGFLNVKYQPLRAHESILVFGKPKYNPQKTKGHKPVNSYTKHTSDGTNYGKTKQGLKGGGSTERYPRSVLKFPVVNNDGTSDVKLHPTQKPLSLMEYLLLTFTDEGDMVLDPFCGSGTTCVVAKRNNRGFLGIEREIKYFKISVERVGSCLQEVV